VHGSVTAQFNTASSGPLIQSCLSHLKSFFLLNDRPLHQLDSTVSLTDLIVRLQQQQQVLLLLLLLLLLQLLMYSTTHLTDLILP